MLRRGMLPLFLTLFALTAAGTQPSANLSGKWKLNTAKSEFGPIPGPDSRSDEIVQNGSEIKQSVVSDGAQGKQEHTLVLTVDGKEHTVPEDSPMAHLGQLRLEKVAASWDNSALVVSETLNFQGNDLDVKNRYDVSAHGAVLTIASHVGSSMGEMDRKFVFDRQDQAALAKPAKPDSAPASIHAAKVAGTPDFTGTWRLDLAQSSFGPVPGPESRTDTIEHTGPTIKIHSVQKGTTQGDLDYSFTLTTDGKPSTMNFQGTEAVNTADWRADILTIDTATMYQGSDLTIKSMWTLSENGKTLTVNSHYASALGELDQKLAFVKQ